MTDDARAPAGGSSKARYLLISLLVAVVDQWSKWMVEIHLPPHTTQPVVPGLNLTHVRNTGVAFGLFNSQSGLPATLILTALGLLALTVVVIYFRRTPANEAALLVALSLILGGAVGNLIDRIASGSVTDFIDVYVASYHWYTFNVADSAITVGIVVMTLDLLLQRPRAAANGGSGARASGR